MKFLSVTTKTKDTEQYFPVMLSMILYRVVLLFGSIDEILTLTIQMKASEKYFNFYGAVYYAVQGCSDFLICG